MENESTREGSQIISGNGFSNIFHEPTFNRVTGFSSNPLNLFLTTHLEYYNNTVISDTLWRSDHPSVSLFTCADVPKLESKLPSQVWYFNSRLGWSK